MKISGTLFAFVTMFLVEHTWLKKQTISAKVVNVMSNKGRLYFCLDFKENFTHPPLQLLKGEILEGVATVIFEEVHPVECTLVSFHDKKNMGKIDFSQNGRPIKAYTASNNAMTIKPLQYEEAKFVVADKNSIFEIKF
jgi:uncharacterized protein (DUF2141 family)